MTKEPRGLLIAGSIPTPGLLSDQQIEDLKDDLLFIRRKQTLSIFFNVALAAFQRGFLKTANQACQISSTSPIKPSYLRRARWGQSRLRLQQSLRSRDTDYLTTNGGDPPA